MSDIMFERVDDDDSEDHNMYLNAAGMDDDINGLMNCHRLDMTAADDCTLVTPKREYLDDDEDADNECVDGMDVDRMEESKDDVVTIDGDDDNDDRIDHLDQVQNQRQQLVQQQKQQQQQQQPQNQRQPQHRHFLRQRSRNRPRHCDEDEDENEEDVDNDLGPASTSAHAAPADDEDIKSQISSLVGSTGQLLKCEFDVDADGVRGGRSTTGASSDDGDDGDDDDDDDDDDDGVVDEDDECDPLNVEVRQVYLSSLDDDETAAGSADGGDEQETMCQICATVFKTRYNLLRHFQKRHPEYKMYECDLCRISFASINEFKEHLDMKHSKVQNAPNGYESKQVRFACDVCGNMYKNKASAMNHLLTHTAKKTVRCPHCDFTCYTKQQLGVHQTKHDKRFMCDICLKRFAQKSQLDVHVKAVHYNERPFACVLCNKSFKTKGSHDAHMIVHTDTRNYQCPHCDKKCRKRYDLTLHIRTHTGEKPFKCSVCGRGFVQMCDTRKHEMLHFKPGKRKNVFYPSPEAAGSAVDDE